MDRGAKVIGVPNMDLILQQVTSVARAVRCWAEERDDLQQHPTGDLHGWCAIAAAHLWAELTRAGLQAEIHMAEMPNGSHAFVLCEDHIVDVTATQFNEYRNNPVVVLHAKEAIHAFHNTTHTFETAQQLRKFQKKNRWPHWQVAYEEIA